MTYKSIIHTLCGTGDLVEIDIPLDAGESRWRRLYGTKGFAARIDTIRAEDQDSTYGSDLSWSMQLDLILHTYTVGGDLHYDHDINDLNPVDRGIWELKTIDLRIFGWFPARDVLICTDVEHTDKVKATGEYSGYSPLYGPFIRNSALWREKLGLDKEYLQSGRPTDVISVRRRVA